MEVLDEIRKASELLYSALNHMLNGDSCQMEDIWSHSSLVTTMHPVGGREIGWEQVQETWARLAKLTSEGKINLEDQFIRVEGETAYELGTEQGKVKIGGKMVSMRHRVTNIYHLEEGKWKVVHHHADLSPELRTVLDTVELDKA